MNGCDKLLDIGRRQFLSGSAIATAGASRATVVPEVAKATACRAVLDYPSSRLALAGSKEFGCPCCKRTSWKRRLGRDRWHATSRTGFGASSTRCTPSLRSG